ncbi:glycosyltransferase family 2 protein [Kineococcus sp. SYSU DK005]|uniref:glycosyltransferase family 2 protein n=1 Tax=Kineococcus sp. SYSU DK005 TaxID=3383126 RepID=UPI003D7EE7BC
MSIITPTYQRFDYLRPAIESALAQTFTDFELIVSDNGPSEEARAIAESYGDPRIVYRHNGRNIGARANAFAAYAAARGEFAAMLHDDDLWEPDFLATLVPPLQQDPTLSLAFSDHWLIDADGTVLVEETERNTRRWGRAGLAAGVHRPFVQQALVDRAVPIAMATVVRLSSLDLADVPADVGTNYDTWIGYLACRDGAGAYYSPRRLTRYRQHPQQITSQARYDRALVYFATRFLSDERLAAHTGQVLRAAGESHTNLGFALLRQGRRREALAELLYGFVAEPGGRPLGGALLATLPAALVRAAAGERTRALQHLSHRRAAQTG